LVGKSASATKEDFVVAYTAATQLTFSSFPAGIGGFSATDIESVRQINAAGVVVATYSRDDVAMESTGVVLTVVGAVFTNTDTFVVFTNVPRAASSGAGGAGGGSIVYTNAAGDFTATANAGTKTITITGLPFTLEAIHVVGGSIKKIDVDDVVTTVPLTDVAVAAGVITLDDADDFVVTDTVYITLIGPDKWYDRDQDNAKVNVDNSDPAHYTDPSYDLVTDAEVGDEFGNWTDQGAEIPCASYNVCRAWVEYTANDSTVPKLRALAKHESGGSDEYDMDDFSEVSLGTLNMKKCYVIPIDHTVPYLQIQTKTGFAGEGGVTTTTTTVGHTNGTISIKYTLGYK